MLGALSYQEQLSLKPVSEKLSRIHCFNLGIFSGKGGKGNVWGRDGRTVSLGGIEQGT